MDLSKNESAVPAHVAIIMDGNGRWAKNRNLPRTSGHSEGLKRAKEIAKAASDLGIKYLTLYVFSTENWKRTQQEVGFLMSLIHSHLRQELDFYRENKIRVRILGDRSRLSKEVQDDIEASERDTADFTGLTICLAINYGGRDEIVRGVRKIVSEAEKSGKIDLESINEESISGSFDIAELPDLDLLIRTGGELRLSNFLLWKAAYAELMFTDTLWPDYGTEEFKKDISDFQKRNRRFGAVPL